MTTWNDDKDMPQMFIKESPMEALITQDLPSETPDEEEKLEAIYTQNPTITQLLQALQRARATNNIDEEKKLREQLKKFLS